MKKLLTVFSLLSAGLALAEDAPTITISKNDKLSVAIAGLAGADAKILQDDLQRSGFFSIVPAAGAAFTANGSGGGALNGTVTDHGGKTVLSKTFSGSARLCASPRASPAASPPPQLPCKQRHPAD